MSLRIKGLLRGNGDGARPTLIQPAFRLLLSPSTTTRICVHYERKSEMSDLDECMDEALIATRRVHTCPRLLRGVCLPLHSILLHPNFKRLEISSALAHRSATPLLWWCVPHFRSFVCCVVWGTISFVWVRFVGKSVRGRDVACDRLQIWFTLLCSVRLCGIRFPRSSDMSELGWRGYQVCRVSECVCVCARVCLFLLVSDLV